jgi:hypothetical protein
MKHIVRTFTLLFLALLCSCTQTDSDAEVIVRNDIQDREFNEIVVDQIEGDGVSPGRFVLKPGEERGLPIRRVKRLRVTRQYRDHKSVYSVTCPAKKKPVLLKLIDIHSNRMRGGCILTNVNMAG